MNGPSQSKRTVCLNTMWREIAVLSFTITALFLNYVFVRRVHRCYGKGLVEIGEKSPRSTFFIFVGFVDGNLLRTWVWLKSHNSAQFREHVDVRFKIVQHIMWELLGKNAFVLITESPAGYFWCESYGGQVISPHEFH